MNYKSYSDMNFGQRKAKLQEMIKITGVLSAADLEFFQACINDHHRSHCETIFQDVEVKPNDAGYPNNNFYCNFSIDGEKFYDIVGIGATLKATPDRDPASVKHSKVLKDLRRNSMRAEVRNYLLENPFCESCGIEVDQATAHVDHCGDEEFAKLAATFIADLGLDTFELKSRVGDADYISDPLIIQAWHEYHDRDAKVQLLCQTCNLSKPKQKVTV